MKTCRLTYLILCLTAMCSLAACTDVDLCPNTVHPHVSYLRVQLNWPESNPGTPEEMYIVASRIVNTWRTYGVVDTTKDPANEDNTTYVASTSDEVTTDSSTETTATTRDGETTDGNTDTTTEGSTETATEGTSESTETTTDGVTVDTSTDSGTTGESTDATATTTSNALQLHGGEYNIFVVNKRTTVLESSGEEAADNFTIENLTNYLHNNEMSFGDLRLQQKTMGTDKPEIVKGNDLSDFNSDYEYLQMVSTPIYYSLLKGVDVGSNENPTLTFDMQPISQEVTINFSIRAPQSIHIDAPLLEMSGICGRFNIAEACLDTTQLYRVALQVNTGDDFQAQAISGTDSIRYACSAHFYTLGVVPGRSSEPLTGPGVIHIAVPATYTTTDANGNTVTNERYIYAGINVHDEVIEKQITEERDGNLYLRYSDEAVVIDISTALIVGTSQVESDESGMEWIPRDEESGSDDVEIEF